MAVVVGLLATCEAGETDLEAEVTPASTAVVASPTPVLAVAELQPTATPTDAPATATPTGVAPVTIRSDDGSVELEIPPGALPDGVGFEDLRVSRVDPESLTALANGVPLLASYILEPDGLSFSVPVQITMNLPNENGEVPLLVLRGDDDIEIVNPREVRIDHRSGTIEIRAEFSHFSVISASRHGFFKLEVFDLPDQYVNVPFKVRATVTSLNQVDVDHIWDFGIGSVTFSVDGPWTLSGTFDGWTTLSPLFVENAPPGNLVDPGGSFTAVANFTCERSGEASILYFAEMNFDQRHEGSLAGISTSRTDPTHMSLLAQGRPFECLAGPPPTPTRILTPTPATTPTPTPTASPTPTVTPTPRPPEGFIDVEVLNFEGEHYPLEQFHLADPDQCQSKHYHAGFRVFSLHGGDPLDPATAVCGFGRAEEVEVTVERIEMAVWEDYRDRLAAATD